MDRDLSNNLINELLKTRANDAIPSWDRATMIFTQVGAKVQHLSGPFLITHSEEIINNVHMSANMAVCVLLRKQKKYVAVESCSSGLFYDHGEYRLGLK